MNDDEIPFNPGIDEIIRRGARQNSRLLSSLKPKNTYGKNAFREVKVKCLQCKGEKITNMQCDTGNHDWDCDLCGETTVHKVTETHPQ